MTYPRVYPGGGATDYTVGGSSAPDPNAFVTSGTVVALIAAAVSAAGGGTAIDDTTPSSTKTFSSQAIRNGTITAAGRIAHLGRRPPQSSPARLARL